MDEKGVEPIIKKHNKGNYEICCPNCDSDDISELTGWCYSHHNPTFDGARPFCSKPDECGFISNIKNALFCNQCDTMYDKEKMANWNWSTITYGNCPVGKEVSETPEEYGKRLLFFITKYGESSLDDLFSKGYYLEAIGTLHIQISEELRLLLTKRIKEHERIPLDLEDSRYKKVLKWIEELKDHNLYEISYIFSRITKKELDQLTELNSLRNAFAHSFDKRKNYSELKIRNIIGNAKKVERRLKGKLSV